MWTFEIATGIIVKDGFGFRSVGYSGSGAGKNNPAFEASPDYGPLPVGDWEICGPPVDTASHGPYTLRLEPLKGTDTFGRAGFMIHGDSVEHPGQASEGCIAVDRLTRTRIWQSGDRLLRVVPGLPVPDLGGEISV